MIKKTLAVVAGAMAGAMLLAIEQYKKSEQKNDIIGEKIYVDQLNMGEIKSWFKDKLMDSGKKGIIFYPTKENLEKWKIDIEESENELIQVVYDEQTNKIMDYREISFSEISVKLNELLRSSGGTIVVDKQ